METGISVLERAFQLAATGRYDTVTHIKRRLDLEGYATLQVSGPTLFKQLTAEIVYARKFTAERSAAEPDGTNERPGTGTRAGSFSPARAIPTGLRRGRCVA